MSELQALSRSLREFLNVIKCRPKDRRQTIPPLILQKSDHALGPEDRQLVARA
jgi:hypothetical protein